MFLMWRTFWKIETIFFFLERSAARLCVLKKYKEVDITLETWSFLFTKTFIKKGRIMVWLSCFLFHFLFHFFFSKFYIFWHTFLLFWCPSFSVIVRMHISFSFFSFFLILKVFLRPFLSHELSKNKIHSRQGPKYPSCSH